MSVGYPTEARRTARRLPDREEAGSPSVVGAIALVVAITVLDGIGLDRIAEHERALTDDALTRLGQVAGARLHGPARTDDASDVDRLVDGVEQLVGDGPGAAYDIERDGSFHPRGYLDPVGFSLRRPGPPRSGQAPSLTRSSAIVQP